MDPDWRVSINTAVCSSSDEQHTRPSDPASPDAKPTHFLLIPLFLPSCLWIILSLQGWVTDSLPCKHLAETALTAVASSQLLTALKKTVSGRQPVSSRWDLLRLTGRALHRELAGLWCEGSICHHHQAGGTHSSGGPLGRESFACYWLIFYF